MEWLRFTNTGLGLHLYTYELEDLIRGGYAVTNPAGQVVDFISVVDDFTALNGPAAGSKAVDIQVREDAFTRPSESLQLVGGPGCDRDDFHWDGPLPSSMDALSAHMSFECSPSSPPSFMPSEKNNGTCDSFFQCNSFSLCIRDGSSVHEECRLRIVQLYLRSISHRVSSNLLFNTTAGPLSP